MLSSKLHSSIGNTDKLYVDDVFSAYTYTGNSSTQTINNGIDLAGEGGMVWTKSRSNAVNHVLVDTARGVSSKLSSDLTILAQSMADGVTSVSSTGYTLGADSTQALVNKNNQTYVSWTFRKAPKFFDVVTYTGNGASNRSIAHSLGQEVGMVMTKATTTTGDWNTYHRSATGDLVLNTTAAQTGSKSLVNSATTSTFTVSGAANTNAVTYVAYLFAHDPSADGIVQCGSFTGMPSSIVLGWEPQYLMIKCTDSTNDWSIYDTARNWASSSAVDPRLKANSSNAEQSIDDFGGPNATGFNFRNEASGTYIYLAIRRPNKPPTTGTQVYNAVTYTGNSTGSTKQTIATGFPPDAVLIRTYRTDSGGATIFGDRLRGNGSRSNTYSTATETIGTAWYNYSDNMQLVVGPEPEFNPGYAGGTCVASAFNRAPGFFDVVCYTGTGSAQTVNHSLGVAPELVIVKCRRHSESWYVYSAAVGLDFVSNLNNTNAFGSGASNSYWGGTTPSASVISLGTSNSLSARTYVAYLFASLPGISKVGSYTGNGSSQTINCGFSTGARFVLIKRTNSAGDWYVWDTARGLVAGNDPHLSLNTTSAEVTTNDSVDPDGTGFIVNQVTATNINVTSATYIFLAVS